jgi:predicted neutral ceramidase superfamily lipid hydrolase
MSNLQIRDGISTVQPPLSQAVGYVVVVVIGVIIALGKYSYTLYVLSKKLTSTVMMIVTRILKKTAGEDNEKTEMYAFPP